MALPAFLDPIVKLDRSYRLLLGAVGLVLLVALPWWFALAPVQDEIATLDARLKQTESDIAQQRALLAQLDVLRLQLGQLEARLTALTDKLPTERDLPPLYRTLSDTAFQTGLAVALFQPRDARIRDYYAEIPITVTAEGGYHDLAEFFDRLAGLSRVVNVGDWKLTGLSRTKNPLRADLTLATYQYRPVGSPPAPKAGDKK
jgi:type IV pilus assembly protein PilO